MTTIRARFTTPTITATPAALEVLAMTDLSPATVLARHFAGEWGGQPDNAAQRGVSGVWGGDAAQRLRRHPGGRSGSSRTSAAATTITRRSSWPPSIEDGRATFDVRRFEFSRIR